MTKYVLFESRGGKVGCGEYAGMREDGRLKAIVGGVVPVVAFKKEKKLTPHELCERHNVLLDEVRRLRAELEAARGREGELRKTLERIAYGAELTTGIASGRAVKSVLPAIGATEAMVLARDALGTSDEGRGDA